MDYLRPGKVGDIARLADGRDVYYLAGGTDIMVLKKENLLEDKPLIDISSLQELKGIEERDASIYIGALETMTSIAKNPILQEKATALVDAASIMGSPIIRNLATIGGNLANSSPAADLIPPLIALSGQVIVQKADRTREIPAESFCTSAGSNLLDNGEIVRGVRIPVQENSFSGFMKLGPRAALAISKVSVAVWWFLNGEEIYDIKIAMGAVGPICFRAKFTEKILKGRVLSPDILEEAAEMIETEARPIDDFRSTADYRRKMTGVLLKRILNKNEIISE